MEVGCWWSLCEDWLAGWRFGWLDLAGVLALVSLCEDWLARWACDGVDRCVGRVRGAFCED